MSKKTQIFTSLSYLLKLRYTNKQYAIGEIFDGIVLLPVVAVFGQGEKFFQIKKPADMRVYDLILRFEKTSFYLPQLPRIHSSPS